MLKWMVAVVLGILSPAALAAPLHLSGEVTYRERIALPDTAILNIQLIDQSLPAAPPRIEVEAPIGPGQVPLSFNLGFEDSIILPNRGYALIASIRVGGGTLFRNLEPYTIDPLALAAPIVIVADLVASTDAASSSEEPAPAPPPAILDVTWSAVEIAGDPVIPRAAPTLAIGNDRRAGGLGGCNSWFAEAQLDDKALRFGSVTSTMKGCTQSINLQEQAFHAALAATVSWAISGDQLTLFGIDGKPLLEFRR
jgi:putative lipoprotein